MDKEHLIAKLQGIIDELRSKSAYERLIDITEKLFYVDAGKIVIVMSIRDYIEIQKVMHTPPVPAISYDNLGVVKDIVTPHGIVSYIILDNGVKKMYGYVVLGEVSE